MFKIKNERCLEIVSDIFTKRIDTCYSLRNTNDFRIPFVNAAHNVTESISYRGPKIWDIVPNETKQKSSFSSFKESIKKWEPYNCPCKICKTYLNGIGFVEMN